MLTKFKLFLLFTIIVCTKINAQDSIYNNAFEYIKQGIEAKSISFKEAVYTVENAYYDNRLSKILFNQEIEKYKTLTKAFINSRELIYSGKDKKQVAVYAGVFNVLSDTVQILTPDSILIDILPFKYDFEDIAGKRDWTKMFVTKLLFTKKGNCHSLPYLYKILCDELGAESKLAFAPNHIYIKQKSEKLGWYNTELTSGMFPKDSWLMASGYIHLDAVRNGIYLKALSEQEALCQCLVDLAQGYKEKHKSTDNKLILEICDYVLGLYPKFINALLLKAETKTQMLYAQNNKDEKYLKTELSKLELLYKTIHNLGYRKMPDKMYLEWLTSLRLEKDKYINTKITF